MRTGSLMASIAFLITSGIAARLRLTFSGLDSVVTAGFAENSFNTLPSCWNASASEAARCDLVSVSAGGFNIDRSSARRSVMSSRSNMAKAIGSASTPSFRKVIRKSRWPIFVRMWAISLTVPAALSRVSSSSTRAVFSMSEFKLARCSNPNTSFAAAFSPRSEPS
jgi:hypothetical protein